MAASRHAEQGVRLSFLGGAGTVTGSRTLIEHDGHRLLMDCGLFQGFKTLRERNWSDPGFDPAQLDAVVLTHAHVDHSGYVPLLVKRGFRGPVHCTSATAGLCRILWPDAAHLQEEEAERANRKGYSKHKPAQPLFDTADAERAMQLLVPHDWDTPFSSNGATLTFRKAGHILGAASVLVQVGGKRILFSGDLGRQVDPMHGPPDRLPAVDALILESTYGNRLHEPIDPEVLLGEIVNRTVHRGGHVIVPAFAVGRTQRLLYHLWRLLQRGEIPDVPIFLNSPLADKATQVFAHHPEAHSLDAQTCKAVCTLPRIAATVEDSIALNNRKEPCIIIAGSGMATGGRVTHHIQAYGPHPKHTILFTGYQAEGTRGDRILSGEAEVKIFGEWVPIRCEVDKLDNLSAHADRTELVSWVKEAEAEPGRIFLNHGSPSSADALRLALEAEVSCRVEAPIMGDVVTLS